VKHKRKMRKLGNTTEFNFGCEGIRLRRVNNDFIECDRLPEVPDGRVIAYSDRRKHLKIAECAEWDPTASILIEMSRPTFSLWKFENGQISRILKERRIKYATDECEFNVIPFFAKSTPRVRALIWNNADEIVYFQDYLMTGDKYKALRTLNEHYRVPDLPYSTGIANDYDYTVHPRLGLVVLTIQDGVLLWCSKRGGTVWKLSETDVFPARKNPYPCEIHLAYWDENYCLVSVQWWEGPWNHWLLGGDRITYPGIGICRDRSRIPDWLPF